MSTRKRARVASSQDANYEPTLDLNKVTMQAAVNILHQKTKDTDITVDAQREEIKALQQTIESQDKRIEDQDDKISELEDANENLNKGRKPLQKQTDQAVAEKAKLEDEVAKLKDRVEELTKAKNNANNRARRMERKLEDAPASDAALQPRGDTVEQTSLVVALKSEIAELKRGFNPPTDEEIRRELDHLWHTILDWARITVHSQRRITFSTSQALPWLTNRMPQSLEDHSAAYTVSTLSCIVATTLLEKNFELGPFGATSDELTISLSKVVDMMQGSLTASGQQKWLSTTKGVLDTMDANIMPSVQQAKTNVILDDVHQKLSSMTNIRLNTHMMEELERLVHLAVVAVDKLHFHEATFVLCPHGADVTFETLEYGYLESMHEDIDATGIGKDEDTRITDLICPGLLKTHKENGERLGNVACAWKAKVLVDVVDASSPPALMHEAMLRMRFGGSQAYDGDTIMVGNGQVELAGQPFVNDSQDSATEVDSDHGSDHPVR